MRRLSRVSLGLPPLIGLVLLPVATSIASADLTVSRWWGWSAALVLATPIVVAEVVERGRRRDEAAVDIGDARLARLVAKLASAVDQQWRAEAATRLLNRPEPIQLRWVSTARSVTVARTGRAAQLVNGRASSGLSGSLAEVMDTLLGLPQRQLVVLGAPGAGKSVLALMLTLDLLDRRRRDPTVPVPALLSISSWQPQNEHLWTWMARRLGEDYPGLNGLIGHGRLEPARLVTGGYVLPILDGLDEISAEFHAAAIEGIDLATAGGVLFVITCRAEEYEQAVSTSGRTLSTAAIVEVEPVDLDAAATYLAQSGPGAAERWQPVLSLLRVRPEAPAAQALSTPLMVWLARTVYTDPGSDPAELVDATRFPNVARIEDYLLDGYLPAVYSARPTYPGSRGRSPYRPDRVVRWLAFLASDLRRQGTYDIAWWRLRGRPSLPIVFAFLTGFSLYLLHGAFGLLFSGVFNVSVFIPLALALSAAALVVRLNEYTKHRQQVNAAENPAGQLSNLFAFRLAGRLGAGVVLGLGFSLGWLCSSVLLEQELDRLTRSFWTDELIFSPILVSGSAYVWALPAYWR